MEDFIWHMSRCFKRDDPNGDVFVSILTLLVKYGATREDELPIGFFLTPGSYTLFAGKKSFYVLHDGKMLFAGEDKRKKPIDRKTFFKILSDSLRTLNKDFSKKSVRQRKRDRLAAFLVRSLAQNGFFFTADNFFGRKKFFVDTIFSHSDDQKTVVTIRLHDTLSIAVIFYYDERKAVELTLESIITNEELTEETETNVRAKIHKTSTLKNIFRTILTVGRTLTNDDIPDAETQKKSVERIVDAFNAADDVRDQIDVVTRVTSLSAREENDDDDLTLERMFEDETTGSDARDDAARGKRPAESDSPWFTEFG